jgi:hypothetical protein
VTQVLAGFGLALSWCHSGIPDSSVHSADTALPCAGSQCQAGQAQQPQAQQHQRRGLGNRRQLEDRALVEGPPKRVVPKRSPCASRNRSPCGENPLAPLNDASVVRVLVPAASSKTVPGVAGGKLG